MTKDIFFLNFCFYCHWTKLTFLVKAPGCLKVNMTARFTYMAYIQYLPCDLYIYVYPKGKFCTLLLLLSLSKPWNKFTTNTVCIKAVCAIVDELTNLAVTFTVTEQPVSVSVCGFSKRFKHAREWAQSTVSPASWSWGGCCCYGNGQGGGGDPRRQTKDEVRVCGMEAACTQQLYWKRVLMKII